MRVMEYPIDSETPPPGDWTHSGSVPCVLCDCDVSAKPHASQNMGPQPPRCVACMRAGRLGRTFSSFIEQKGTKDTNPKDAIAGTKVPLGMAPLPAQVEEALAYLEGALKYGSWNWTISGVRASVYVLACARHLAKWYFGQECDPKTKVHHLGNARACLGLLIDAQARGVLNDDRPPALPDLDGLFSRAEEVVTHLQKLYQGRDPRHYTIADRPEKE